LHYLFGGERATPQPLVESLPFEVLENQELNAVVTTDVVKGAKMWIRKNRDRSRILLKSEAKMRVLRE